jgi:hypothetical protein
MLGTTGQGRLGQKWVRLARKDFTMLARLRLGTMQGWAGLCMVMHCYKGPDLAHPRLNHFSKTSLQNHTKTMVSPLPWPLPWLMEVVWENGIHRAVGVPLCLHSSFSRPSPLYWYILPGYLSPNEILNIPLFTLAIHFMLSSYELTTKWLGPLL